MSMTPPPPERDAVLGSYADALTAFRGFGLTAADWDVLTPCGEWNLLDLSGHLLAIARYYHRLLDAAEAGHHLEGLPRGGQLAAMNARDLRDLVEPTGDERMEFFLELASAHLQRLQRVDWKVILGDWSGLGPLTVGQHSGVAIGEWHVHAWDMARSFGAEHRPSDPVVVAEGNRVVRNVSYQGDPWQALLRAYGRDPNWTAVPR